MPKDAKTLSLCVLIVLGILTLLGLLQPFSFLRFLPRAQFWLLGYIGYIWSFALAFGIYKTQKLPNIHNPRFLEQALGITIGIFALLVLQGVFFNKAGILGVAFNDVLKPIIAPLGVFTLSLMMLILSIILYSGKSPQTLFKMSLAALKDDFKKDLESTKAQKEKLHKNKEKLKHFWLQTKAFFSRATDIDTKPQIQTKEDSKDSTIKDLSIASTQNTESKPTQPDNINEEPRPLTLQELIEQNKDNPPPRELVHFNFDDIESQEEEEEHEEMESRTEIPLNTGFKDEIDTLRQDIELPMREDNPLEDSAIRIIDAKNIQPDNFDSTQFKMQSMASLENFKRFEKQYFHDEPEEDEPIKLIKRDSIAESQKTLETYDVTKSQDSAQNTSTQAPQIPQTNQPQKRLKSYPKNLYATTPFSAYYDKEPVGTHDGLIDAENLTKPYPQKNDLPSTIFYYGNTKSTHPLSPDAIPQNTKIEKLQEAQEIAPLQETTQNTESLEVPETIETQNIEAPNIESQKAEIALEIPQRIENTESQSIVMEQPTPNTQTTENITDNANTIPQPLEIAKPQTTSQETIQNTESQSAVETAPEATQSPAIETAPINPVLPSTIPIFNYGYYQSLPQEHYEPKPTIPQAINIVEVPQPAMPTPQPQQNAESQNRAETIHLFKSNATPQTSQPTATQTMESQPIQNTQSTQPMQTPIAPEQTPYIAPTSQPTQTIQPQPVQNIQNTQPIAPPTHNVIPQNSTTLDETNKEYMLPSIDFLQLPKHAHIEVDEGEIDRKINDLLNKMRVFKIEGDIVRTYSGPIVTTFEFRPNANVKVSRILTLQDDLAMALRAKTIRIQAPIPGKDVVGIEIPNGQVETIYLREILDSQAFINATSPLTLALGKDIVGNPFVADLKKLPHLLIAGTTGSGKSVGVNAMILSLLYRNPPDKLKLIMVDPKMVEFSMYNDIPHLLTPVITDPKNAIFALDVAVKEMERRNALISEARVKNIDSYNQKAEIDGFEPFPYIVIIIDELADLMMTGGKEAEASISRLTQMARSSGIHLIVATQRPSVDVVTGLIKANLPSRISYKVGQKIDSKVILDCHGAESLLGNGDMLFAAGGGNVTRLHAPFSTEEEIERIVDFIKAQCPPQYDPSFNANVERSNAQFSGEADELYEEAKQIMLESGKTSISYLQRRFNVGYNRAANIIEQMEIRGFLSKPNTKGIREIIGE